MMKYVLASGNSHKCEEFKRIFQNDTVLSMAEVWFTGDINENGTTFEDNALIKARAVQSFLQSQGKMDYIVLSDDTGLCVPSLNGEPGLYSARYAGTPSNPAANRKKLLDKLQGKEGSDRNAYFIAVIAEVFPDGSYLIGEGKTYGHIEKEEKDNKAFGYDCLFFSDDLQKTFAECSMEEKNRVSHRGRAIQHLLEQQNTPHRITQ